MIPPQKDAVMKEHISQWKKSGLTQIAYCNEHNIKPHIFSYYKAKLTQTDSAPLPSELIPVNLISTDSELAKSADNSDTIRLTHANGFSIEINAKTSLSVLKPLLDLVRSVA